MASNTEPQEENFEDLAYTQRLKAAVHYTVGQICEQECEDEEYEYSKQVMAVIAETTFRYVETMATDLELFAKHAKRNTINSDDVKLLVRKSPKLHEYMKDYSEQIAAENEEKRKDKQLKKRSNLAASVSKKNQTNACATSENITTADDD